MNYSEAANPKAVTPGDRYIVVNDLAKVIVESHFSPDKAERACSVLNEHEKLFSRLPCYAVIDKVSDFYVEGALYGFVRTDEGTEPANGAEPEGWCFYLHKKNKLTGEFMDELFEEDFDDPESAHLAVERLTRQYGAFEVDTY